MRNVCAARESRRPWLVGGVSHAGRLVNHSWGVLGHVFQRDVAASVAAKWPPRSVDKSIEG